MVIDIKIFFPFLYYWNFIFQSYIVFLLLWYIR